MLIENVNDILSILTLSLLILVPLYFAIKKLLTIYHNTMEKRLQKLMKEDDWHM